MTKSFRFGLIGSNIAYSRSVDIFNKIFELDEVDGKADIFDIKEDDFHRRFPEIIKSGVNGLSVTIPYKEKVVQYLSKLDSSAGNLKIVNSIYIKENETIGFNTDIDGFSYPLIKYAEQLDSSKAIILGCGGSAKAVARSLYKYLNIDDFMVVSRDLNKLKEFKISMAKVLEGASIGVSNDFSCLTNQAGIIVNCTPLGGWNYPDDSPIPKDVKLSKNIIYYDLNYNSDNKVVSSLKSKELTVLDGSRMLVAQALRSYQLWTGVVIPFELVYKEIFKS